MAYTPAKIIENKLRKVGISVNGFYVIENIDMDYIKEAKRLGMDDGITDRFDFHSEYSIEGGTLTFYGSIIEDYRQVTLNQELPYYYPHLESCTIKLDGKEEIIIDLDVYWGK
ncbi:hypothetical protein [Neobacillus drentensis]|uniref:hypothetical protein n=1 Tax=Neobacillus drentensis TaxID=220684 RepID=UPI0030009A3E